MKKITAVLAALMILVCGTAALAEGTTEYSDEYYGFSHPENWKREAAEDGTVILQSPDGKAYVRADILLTDLFSFTGKEEEDATFVKAVMESFAGEGTGNTQPTLLLDGPYELITAGELKGFRAPGTWRPTGDPALLDVFTGGGSMVSFTMVGNPAIELEDTLISGLRITDRTAETENGMIKWESEKISLYYPETFRMMSLGRNGGVIFTDASGAPSTINVMTSELKDKEYSDVYGLAAMKKVLEQTGSGLDENMKVAEINGRHVIVAEGIYDGMPVANYLLGQGKTVAVLSFTGESAVGQAEALISSIKFK